MEHSKEYELAKKIAAKSWKKLRKSKLVAGRDIGKVPPVIFKDLGEKYYGLGYIDKIELNSQNLGMLSTDDFLNEVIPHELAHTAEFRLKGKSGHGKFWRKLCIAAGGNGEVGSDYYEKVPYWTGVFMLTGLLSSIFLIAVLLRNCGMQNGFLTFVCSIAGGLLASVVLWAAICDKCETVIKFAAIQSIVQTAVFFYLK